MVQKHCRTVPSLCLEYKLYNNVTDRRQTDGACKCRTSVASIPIPGGLSLRPVKNRGKYIFLFGCYCLSLLYWFCIMCSNVSWLHCFLCVLCNTHLLLTVLMAITSIFIVHFYICILPKYFLMAVGEEEEDEASGRGNEPDFDSRFGDRSHYRT